MLPRNGTRASQGHKDVHGSVGGVGVGQGAIKDEAAEGYDGAGLFSLAG